MKKNNTKIKANLSNMYTDKQVQAFRNYASGKFKIMILSGAVRTGKTVVDNDLFMIDVKRAKALADRDGVKEPIYILAGYSSKTIENNVLNPIRNRYHIEFKFNKHGGFTLFGVNIVMAYTGSMGGVGAIRGLTAYGAYVNEASMAVEDVFKEINNRVTPDEAHIIADTNPDSPTHWLKTNYIDNTDPDASVVTVNFKLDDNKRFLGDKYIRQLKAAYGSGAMYDRAILGLWTSGEGAVYVDWYDEQNYINREDLPPIKKYYAGVDWGYKHYGSIVIVGEDRDGNCYLVDEYSRTLRGIEFWKDVAHDMIEKYGNIEFVCDTARTENIDAFLMDDIDAIFANKHVDKGIELVASLIKTRSFKVVRDVLQNRDEQGNSVSIFEDNIHGYVWDKKKGVVVKLHDDCLDAIRYVLMYIYEKRGTTSVADMWTY